MPAIPTTYNGICFRSRIEARWASFFDLLKWPWEYEPIDLDGYIPDFILNFEFTKVLVEVKSELDIDGLDDHFDKIIKSGWRRESVVSGSVLFNVGRFLAMGRSMNMCTAIIGDDPPYECRDEIVHGDMIFIVCAGGSSPCRKLSISTSDFPVACRRCGNGIESWDRFHIDIAKRDAMRLWRKAGNITQWRGSYRR